MDNTFQGFPAGAPQFLLDLKENNNKTWFEANREWYNSDIIQPAQKFIVAMGERLREISPNIVADPRIDRSIFRIHRDTRFTHSAEPYKAHLGIWMWEGAGKKMECSGYYFHIEPPTIFLGSGMYLFEPELLKLYRVMVVDPVHGEQLQTAVSEVTAKGDYEFGFQKFKKLPRGADPKHPNARFLLHNGLYAGYETVIPPELFTADLVDLCFEHYRNTSPIHKWVLQLTEDYKKRKVQ